MQESILCKQCPIDKDSDKGQCRRALRWLRNDFTWCYIFISVCFISNWKQVELMDCQSHSPNPLTVYTTDLPIWLYIWSSSRSGGTWWNDCYITGLHKEIELCGSGSFLLGSQVWTQKEIRPLSENIVAVSGALLFSKGILFPLYLTMMDAYSISSLKGTQLYFDTVLLQWQLLYHCFPPDFEC